MGSKTRIELHLQKLKRRINKANVKSIGHAARLARLTAQRSIKKREKPSTPGSPPHTQKNILKKSILYSISPQKDSAIIGPGYSFMGLAAATHEFGGKYKETRYPRRSFMGPTLEKIKPRLPRLWAGSVRN